MKDKKSDFFKQMLFGVGIVGLVYFILFLFNLRFRWQSPFTVGIVYVGYKAFELLKDNLVYCAKPFIIKSVSGPILPYNFDAAIVWPASNQEIQTALNRWITL